MSNKYDWSRVTAKQWEALGESLTLDGAHNRAHCASAVLDAARLPTLAEAERELLDACRTIKPCLAALENLGPRFRAALTEFRRASRAEKGEE